MVISFLDSIPRLVIQSGVFYNDLMSKIIPVQNSAEPIKTSDFPYAHWPFESFNQVQSALIPIVNKDCNVLIASATSSGKTIMSEMFGSYELRKNKRKMLFLCPLRALANEKYNDWIESGYHFSDLKIGIFTGDYKSDTSDKEMGKYDILIMTSEMLNHKIRNGICEFVKDIGVCVIDESHLLTVEGRGDHLESAIINFSRLNNTCRFVLLSATLPNVEEVAEWFATSINNKDTYVLRSTHRPCPLKIHIMKYDDQSDFGSPLNELVESVCKCTVKYYNDKFLIFVHAKKIGEMIVEGLARRNIEAKFHNANLDKTQRIDIEKDFKKNKEHRVLVATSTLAWGVNLAARRVIIAGVTRGPELVPSYDILQMMGRAGRPPYDTEGDAHVFFPNSRAIELSKIALQPEPIRSKILDVSFVNTYDTLCFHIISEINSNRIKNKNDIVDWYSKTLSHHQKIKINNSVLESTIERLLKSGLIIINELKEFDITTIGKVASIMYFNPFDLSNLVANFGKLFKQDSFDDMDLSFALAHVGSNVVGNLSKQDKIDMQSFLEKLEKKNKKYPENITKIAYLYNKILNGRHEQRHFSLYKTLQNDISRTLQALKIIDSMGKRWNKKDFFSVLEKRAMYGVPAKLVGLIEIKGIGKIRAEKLFNKGIKNKKEIIQNIDVAASVCGISKDRLMESCS